MVYEIGNECLKIKVKSLGAELTSIRDEEDGLEYLWQGDPAYWSGQSYILFPIIGGLPEDAYRYKGQSFVMKSHGFARGTEFEMVEQTSARLVFRMRDSAETHAQYPFRFELLVTYAIEGNQLMHGLSVVNRGDGEMLFSIGAHPGFNCPLLPGESMEDYRLEFEREENLERREKSGGLLTGERHPFLVGSSIKPLSHELFQSGAAILKGVRSNWLEIRSTRNPHVIRIQFGGFTDLGVWSSAGNAPFVCIEPWFGVDSTKGDSPDFELKEGIVRLAAGKTFSCAYVMTFSKE
jgi:galactose mutarotase-like enzyme